MAIVFIVGEFPSDTEHFIQNEIAGLAKRGFTVHIMALKRAVGKNIRYTPNGSMVYARFFTAANIASYFWMVWYNAKNLISAFQRAIVKSKSPWDLMKNIRCLHVSIFLAFKLRNISCDLIHAHFIAYPATIGVIVATLLGKPFSVSAHARDIYFDKRLKDKVDVAEFVLTCCHYNKDQLVVRGGLNEELASKIKVIYHGIDSVAWSINSEANRRIAVGARAVHILAIGRLIPKKGFPYLLQAVKILSEQGLGIRCMIVGDGPMYRELSAYIETNQLDTHISLLGARSRSEVYWMFRDADIFVLPAIVSDDGDRDGLPNVLVESLAMGVPVITTPVAGVTELIKHRETGILVPERDAHAIADAIKELRSSSPLYSQLSDRGRRTVERNFDITHSIDQLVDVFHPYI